IHGQYRTKNLFFHGFEMRIMSPYQGWRYEISFGVIIISASDDFTVIGFPHVIDIGSDTVKCLLVNNRTHKIAEIFHITIRYAFYLVQKLASERRPDRLRNVHARGRRTFLSLVFISGADSGNDQGIDVCGVMGKNEILST